MKATLADVRDVQAFLRALKKILDQDTKTQVQELVDDFGGPDNPILAAWYR